MEKLMQALLIIDVQNDYFPGGRFELAGAVEALERTRAVLDRFREKGLPVIFVQHINTRPDASFSSRIPSARKSIRTLLPRGMSRLS